MTRLSPVRHSIEETIATITLDSEAPDNRIDASFAAAFRNACAAVAAAAGVRAVMIRSGHADFCSGGGPATSFLNLDAMRVAAAVSRLRHPVIAALSGAVLDQGLELALAADLRVASPDAHLAMRQVVAGSFPFDGGTQRLARLAGPALAMEMLLTGREISADEAQQRGLITEIAANPLERAGELARVIARRGALATIYTREAVLAAGDLTFEQGARLEADLSFLLHGTPEREEGLAAFRERRAAVMPGAPPHESGPRR